MLKILSSLVLLGGVQACISYVLSVWLANYLGPEKFGLYSFVLACGALGSLVVNFGTTETGVKLALERGAFVLNSIVTFRLLSLGLFAVGCAVYAAIYSNWLLIGAPVVASAALSLAVIYEYRNQAVRASYIYTIERLSYAGLLLMIITVGIDITLVKIFLVLLIIQLLSLTFQVSDIRLAALDFRLSGFRKIFAAGVNQFLYQIGKFGYGGGTRIVIFSTLGAGASGNFSVAWSFIPLATIYFGQVVKVFRLPLTKFWGQENGDEYIKYLVIFFLLLFLPSAFAALIFFNFGHKIMAYIFSSQYASAGVLAKYVGIYFVVGALEAFVGVTSVIMNTVRSISYINGFFSLLALAVSYSFSDSEVSFFLILILMHSLALIISMAVTLRAIKSKWISGLV